MPQGNAIKRKQIPRDDRPHNREYLVERRKKLRSHLTAAEATLWRALKNSQIDGRKFRRQHSIGNFIVGFYCPSERLALECDGNVHRSELAALKDHERTQYLNERGVKVLRFENFLIFEDMPHVIGIIKSFFGWWERAERSEQEI